MFQLLETACPDLRPTSLWRAKLSSSSFTTNGMLIAMTRDAISLSGLYDSLRAAPSYPYPGKTRRRVG